MRQTFQFLVLAIMLTIAASCQEVRADGPVISQTRNHSQFTAISSSVAATVTYTQSPQFRVEIRAQQAILDKMKSEVVNGELRFYYPKGAHIGNHEPINIYVSAPDVNDFDMAGSGKLQCSELQAINKTVKLEVSGSGSINFSKLTAAGVDAEVAGSGKMTVAAGTVTKESCEISGSGHIDFNGLNADDVEVDISGSGKVHTTAKKTLDVSISGSGKVYYNGTPRVKTSISGSGKLVAN